MSQDFILITGGDAAYFELIFDCVQSIRRLPEGRDAPVGIIDAGLTSENVRALQALGAKVVSPDWEYDILKRRAKDKEYLKANIGKAFLDRYFPDYDVLMWIDADAWLQTWDAIPLFVDVAKRGKLAIVSRSTRYRGNTMGLRWRAFGMIEPRSVFYKNARRAGLPKSLVREIANRPVLNAGAYAIHRDAPHWEAWRRHQENVLQKGRVFTSDQLALGLAVYIDGHPFEPPPDWCNYLTGNGFRVDTENNLFVERFAPYTPISIVHMAGGNMREDPTRTIPMLDLDDNTVNRSMRFNEWIKTQDD